MQGTVSTRELREILSSYEFFYELSEPALEALAMTSHLIEGEQQLQTERGGLRKDAVRPTHAAGVPMLERPTVKHRDHAIALHQDQIRRVAQL